MGAASPADGSGLTSGSAGLEAEVSALEHRFWSIGSGASVLSGLNPDRAIRTQADLMCFTV